MLSFRYLSTWMLLHTPFVCGTIGPSALYARLNGQTLNAGGNMYGGGAANYIVRPYVDANQQAGGTYFLGNFNTFVATNGVYDYMYFSGGSSAGCPRQRDLKMWVTCGGTFVTNSVAEPSICAYTLNISLPEACGISYAVGDEGASALPMPAASPSITPTRTRTPSASPYPVYKWVHWTSATSGVRGTAYGYVDLSVGVRVNVTYSGEIQTAALHGAASDPFSSQGWFLPPRATGFYLNPYEGWSMYGGGTKASIQLSRPVQHVAVGLISVGQPSVQQTLLFNSAVKRGPVNYNFGSNGLSFPSARTVTGNEGNGVVINDETGTDAGLGIDALLWTHVGYEVYTVLTTGVLDEPLPVTGGDGCAAGFVGGVCETEVPILPLSGDSGTVVFQNMTGAGSTGNGPVAHAFPRARFFSLSGHQAMVNLRLTTCLTDTAVDTYIYVVSTAPRGSLSANQLGLVAFNDDQGENTPWGGTVACSVGTTAAKKSLIVLPSPSLQPYWVVVLLRGATDGAVGLQWTITWASPSPTPSATPSVTASASVTPSISPSSSVTPSVTTTVTETPSVSPSLSPTASISATGSVTPSETPTRSTSGTRSPSLSPSASISATASVTPSETPSVSPSLSPTGSVSATGSVTSSVTPTRSQTSSVTPTTSTSLTPTTTASVSPSATTSVSTSPSTSVTPTVSVTPTRTSSISPSASVSPSVSVTPSVSPSVTVTPSVSTTTSRTVSPSASVSPSSSVSATTSVSTSGTATPSASVSPSSSVSATASLSASGTVTPSASVSPSSSISATASVTPSVTPSPRAAVAAPLAERSAPVPLAAILTPAIVSGVLVTAGVVSLLTFAGCFASCGLTWPILIASISSCCCCGCCAACGCRRRRSRYVCKGCKQGPFKSQADLDAHTLACEQAEDVQEQRKREEGMVEKTVASTMQILGAKVDEVNVDARIL